MVKKRSPGEVRDAVVEYLSSEKKRTVTSAEVRAAVEASLDGVVAHSSVRSYLQLLEEKGRIVRVSRGSYQWKGK